MVDPKRQVCCRAIQIFFVATVHRSSAHSNRDSLSDWIDCIFYQGGGQSKDGQLYLYTIGIILQRGISVSTRLYVDPIFVEKPELAAQSNEQSCLMTGVTHT